MKTQKNKKNQCTREKYTYFRIFLQTNDTTKRTPKENNSSKRKKYKNRRARKKSLMKKEMLC